MSHFLLGVSSDHPAVFLDRGGAWGPELSKNCGGKLEIKLDYF